jgi:hypothetical protein
MFSIAFDTDGMASTLNPDEVCENHDGRNPGEFSRTHSDGWTISGYVFEDYYTWVNVFEAHHPAFGRVWGDFGDRVFADSQAGYDAFCANHGPVTWDYGDI